MPLAGRTAGRHAVATGSHQPVHLRRHLLEIDLAIFSERRGHRRYDAGRTHLHGEPSRFDSQTSRVDPAYQRFASSDWKKDY
jgi:hypothetical protein